MRRCASTPLRLRLDPALFQAFYQRAIALLALGRESEAEADFRKVIELDPNFARAHRALGQILLDRGATDEARRELARAIELDPKLSGIRIYYASAQIKSGDHAGAIETLRAAFVGSCLLCRSSKSPTIRPSVCRSSSLRVSSPISERRSTTR